jgi:hypothetical protein
MKTAWLRLLGAALIGGFVFWQLRQNGGVALGYPPPATASIVQGLTPRAYLPAIFKDFPPVPTTSRYMQTTNGTVLYNLGCSRATARQNGVVILDFGQPWYQNSTYGVIHPASSTFATLAQVEEAVKQFMRGYWNCSAPDAFVHVAVGTNNYGSYTGFSHGQAWTQMVNSISTWITSPPSYASKISVAGATDIEPAWNSVTRSRGWVDGFDSGNMRLYYNYGTCDGCPHATCPTCVPGSATYPWTVEDIWYVSWGAQPAQAIPEIYLTNGRNADQWQRVSLHGYINHQGNRIRFSGTLTQWLACQNQSCPGTNNTPQQGYLQLYQALYKDTRTAWPIQWSTDISWYD